MSIDQLNQKVSAIIPAFNEGLRIQNVLEPLTNVDWISEIIVIDDGSDKNDKTKEICKNFSKIIYLKNEKNIGKAASMNRGVMVAKNDIIFFSDADLKGLTAKDIETMIEPIIKNETDMFLGIRKNKMQTFVKAFSLNTGERALRKSLWLKLPDFYKYRYRIEMGLNLFAKKFGNGYKYQQFNYYQTLKEKKYGFWKGTFYRWWMNWDVSLAFLRFQFYDRWKKF